MKNIKYKIIILVLIFSIGFNFYQFIQFKNTKNNDIADISYYESKLKTAHNIIGNYEKKINDLTEENKEKNYTSNFKEEEKREDLHPIDYKVQECMKNRNYTTMGMAKCVLDSEKDWGKEIEKNLAELKKFLTKEEYNMLLENQQKWYSYKESEKKIINETYFKTLAQIYATYASSDIADISERRARDLTWFLDLMKNRDKEKHFLN